jgi:hypothetical protein
MITANDFISDNLTMTGPDQGSSSPRRRILRAPFTRRTWDELAYSAASLLLALGALIFIVPTLVNGLLWALSAPGVRNSARPAASSHVSSSARTCRPRRSCGPS